MEMTIDLSERERQPPVPSAANSCLAKWLMVCSQTFRTEATDGAVFAFKQALSDLTPAEIDLGFREALKRIKFFPTPAEIRECLNLARADLKPTTGRLNAYEEETPAEETAEDRAAREKFVAKLRELASSKTMPGGTGPGPTYALCSENAPEKSAFLTKGEEIFAKQRPGVIAATESAKAKFLERFSAGKKGVAKTTEEPSAAAPDSGAPLHGQ